MNEFIEKVEFENGMYAEIWQDDYPENPRDYMDFKGTMLCNHRRYDLGDKELEYHGISMFDDFKQTLKSDGLKLNDVIYLPLYLYDHSGITMNTTGFSCAWDSGQVGYIYISKQEIREELGFKRITKKLKERVEKILVTEVEDYDYYLRGEIYGVSFYEKDGEEIDSCGGFLGYDTVLAEAKSQLKYYEKRI